MLDVYKKMEAEGKIGKMRKNAMGIMEVVPFQEYPKDLHLDGGKRTVTVHSHREELLVISEENAPQDDPVSQERNELLNMVTDRDLRAKELEEKLKVQALEIEEMRKLLGERAAKPKPEVEIEVKHPPVSVVKK